MHNWERISRWMFYIFAALLVTSCGGGGGDGLLSLQGVSTYKVNLATSSSSVASSGSADVVVSVVDASNNKQPNQTVGLSLNGPGALSASTVTTDATGMATVQLKGNGASPGSGYLVATYTDSKNNVTSTSLQYSVIDGQLAASNYKIEGALSAPTITTSGAGSSVVATIKLIPPTGLSAAGQTLALNLLNSGSVGQLSSSTVTTNSSGQATVTISGISQNTGSNQLLVSYTDSNLSKATTAVPFDIINGYTLLLTSAKDSLKSGAGDAVELTAFVINSARSVVANELVTFSILSGGGILNRGSTTTDANGQAKVLLTLDAATDPSNHDILVRASIGKNADTSADTVTLHVAGTQVDVSTLNNNITIGDKVDVTAILKNGNGVSIANQPVVFTSEGNISGSQTVMTNSLGQAKLSQLVISTAKDGVATVRADALNASGLVNIAVSSVSFQFVEPITNELKDASGNVLGIDISQGSPVTVTLQDTKPIGTRTAFISATLGQIRKNCSDTTTINSVTLVDTNLADGINKASATFCITSSFPGEAILQAKAQDASGAYALQATRTTAFVSRIPAKLVSQAAQTTLSPNAQTEIVAKVVDANDNPVKGVTVNFNRASDPSNGSLSSSAVVTDSSGQARVTFTAGANDTATDGVKIQAALQDFPSVKSPTTLLTVGGKAVFVAIATGNTLQKLNQTTYAVPHQVTVTDSTGAPIPNATVTLSVIPIKYYKGFYLYSVVDKLWIPQISATCWNEDLNSNGILDPMENDGVGNVGLTASEFLTYPDQKVNDNILDNGDGRLWPGNPITLSSSRVTTDSSGVVNFNILYGASFANWLRVKLVATAQVTGSESTTERFFNLSALSDDIKDQAVTPPGGTSSPYGLSSVCTNPN